MELPSFAFMPCPSAAIPPLYGAGEAEDRPPLCPKGWQQLDQGLRPFSLFPSVAHVDYCVVHDSFWLPEEVTSLSPLLHQSAGQP